jgi:hypothetical protein
MAGFPPIFSFLATGFQGIIGRGMQRPGTKTGTGPIIFQFMGLMGDMQFPKAGIFNMGMISNWPASDLILELNTLAIGSTIIFFGPAPKVHFNLAPMHTHLGICFFWILDGARTTNCKQFFKGKRVFIQLQGSLEDLAGSTSHLSESPHQK